MLSQTADYALTAVVYLVDHPGEPSTIQQIAAETQVPAGYLSKVMQTLARQGIVRSQRGQGGGFTLAKAPEDLSLLEIVQAVDPIRRFHHCPRGRKDHQESLCCLHSRLDRAAAEYERALRETFMADLAENVPPCRSAGS